MAKLVTMSREQSGHERPALLVFSDDWGRHPSSCQHLVRRLLEEYRVWWVNTIGMRPPGLDPATLRRGWEKLRHWFRPGSDSTALPTNLRVLNPPMWPWFTRPRDRWINRKLLLRQLVPRVTSCDRPVVAVTTLPLVAELIEELPVVRWVYYCVDDFSQWPGVDQVAVEEMEEQLVRRADVLISASRTLQDRLAGLGRPSYLLTHGVDLDHWTGTADSDSRAPWEGLERPLVVFWGLIDRRMDVDFVHRLAGDVSRGTILLVGPEADPDPALYRAGRVARLPGIPYEELPALAHAAAVLVMPYADLPVTRAMQPLKLTEYLATGRPVVVRDLPAAADWADALDTASTAEEFSRAVVRRLATGLPESQATARGRLQYESWAEKARQFQRLALTLESSELGAEETTDAG